MLAPSMINSGGKKCRNTWEIIPGSILLMSKKNVFDKQFDSTFSPIQRVNRAILGNILLSVGICEIREDCCWTAKHVGTEGPQKNTAMDEISLLSLSTTELGHCCQGEE